MTIRPKPYPNGKGFFVEFRHPDPKFGRLCRLDTRDQTTADAICIDALSLFNNPEILQRPTAATLVPYERKALDLVFGKERAAETMGDAAKGLTPEDVGDLKKVRTNS